MAKQISAVVVDDERLARVELCDLLAAYDNVHVIGEAATLREAEQVIQEQQPTVIFLDIQLGSESGFDLLNRAEISCEVIFVTAYDYYAVRAFEVNAVDYLLKPVNPARLDETLKRLEGGSETPSPPLAQRYTLEDRLFVRVRRRWRFLRIDEIRCIEAAGDYSSVYTVDGEKLLLNKPMRAWEEQLPAPIFVRIHRSVIVNLNEVERVDSWTNRTFRVHIKGVDEPFPMSRRYAAKLKR